MPTLDNPRHEQFCQCVFLGKSATQCYSEAGYKRDRGIAFNLLKTKVIKERIEELKENAAINES